MRTRTAAIRQMRRLYGAGAVGIIWRHPTAYYWVYSTIPATVAAVSEVAMWGTTPVVGVEHVGPDTAE